MSIIKVENLSFNYEDSSENIFSNLNLNLDSSWKLGLVGRNGRGKTTFLNLLRGNLKGVGQIQTKLNFSYFPLKIDNPENITIYELQAQLAFEQWQLNRELNLMGVDNNLIWQPFATLSGGEQTKILLATSFLSQDSFALIDEPTNHLDEQSRVQVANYLKNQKNGYIVVSHDREFLNQVTNHILAIENQEIHLYQGNFSVYEDSKQKRDQFNQNKNEKLKGQIASLKESAHRVKQYAEKSERNKMYASHANEPMGMFDRGYFSHKAAKIMKKSKNMEKHLNQKIKDKEGLLTNIEESPDLTMNFKKNYHPTLLDIKHLTLALNDRELFEGLNLAVKNQGILALEGKNGSGKSTLLKLILQQVSMKTDGKLMLTNGLKISYLPQNFTKYHGTLKAFAKNQKISYELLLNNLKKMGFPRTSFSTPIEEMSMGQQKRVAIAKSLVEEANLYLWDEPANYLDVFNQDQLIKLLKSVHPAMLLVEHDDYFIKQVADNRIKLV